MRRKRLLTSTWQTSLAYNQMLGQNVINTFWFERPLWVAVDPFTAEEEAPEVEEFIYHRPVLESEVLELLEPRPGSLIVDADRDRRILYLHVIGVRNEADVEAQRESVLGWERRIVRAVGSRAQLALVSPDVPSAEARGETA